MTVAVTAVRHFESCAVNRTTLNFPARLGGSLSQASAMEFIPVLFAFLQHLMFLPFRNFAPFNLHFLRCGAASSTELRSKPRPGKWTGIVHDCLASRVVHAFKAGSLKLPSIHTVLSMELQLSFAT
jgi:hypothetical protein